MSKEYVDEWIAREAGGRIFLDYACGNGAYAVKAAKAGAALSVGIDRVLTRIPLVRLMAWIFTFELVKEKRHGSKFLFKVCRVAGWRMIFFP
jgi:hypothetical protein